MARATRITMTVEYQDGKILAIHDEIPTPLVGIFAGLNPSPGNIHTKMRDMVRKMSRQLDNDEGWRRPS